MYKTPEQFKETIKSFIDRRFDIIEWNNEPHLPAIWIRQVLKEMKVEDRVKLIVDVHDSDLVRNNTAPVDEIQMCHTADGIVYPASAIRKVLNKAYRVNVPNTCLISYCNDGIVEYKEEDIPNRKSLVYEGGANPPPQANDGLHQRFRYRNLYYIIKQLVEMGNEVHMFCGNIDAFETYQDTGAVLYPPTNYDDLMKQLVNYKYGLAIFDNPNRDQNQVNLTLTNKAHEYLQAGLPIIACWCGATEGYTKKHNLGFTFDNLEEIGNMSRPELHNKYLEFMDNIKTKRKELVMENFIWRVENLYAQVLGVERKTTTRPIKRLSVFEYGRDQTEELFG